MAAPKVPTGPASNHCLRSPCRAFDGFVCLASCGTGNNLLRLRQLMDSAGAGAHEMGTERHIGEVCGLEGRGGAATKDGEQSLLCCLPALGSGSTQGRCCGALHLVSQP